MLTYRNLSIVLLLFVTSSLMMPSLKGQDAASTPKDKEAKSGQPDGKQGKSEKEIDVSKMKKLAGFFDFYWDEEQGKVWLVLPPSNERFLYVTSLATGLGSNPVGLDRGQLGKTALVRLRRVGPRVFLEQENTKYRAVTENQVEQRAVAESFASSILWSGKVENSSDEKKVVDISGLLLRDAHDCIGKLSRTGQGKFTFDKNRSYVYLPRTRAFPDNCEFEVATTFASNSPGTLARRVAATGDSVTVRQHHSFVRLPAAGYRPREFDPRSGCFSLAFSDYAAPIGQPLVKRLITRHRLTKKNPTADISEPVEPIVYYVDAGVPQPVRDALIEGASWWNEAFEEIGFKDAFQVKVLPEDADPMDVRYNVIQWVHRATRGWSYGQSVVDPRTGEIIKGHVLLGSLRVRQDYRLMQGLAMPAIAQGGPPSRQPFGFSPAANFCGEISGLAPGSGIARLIDKEQSQRVALARIRQLSAHEVGHTLGFAHNFAASTYGDRASVMDYPAPRTKIVEGKIDLSDAYGIGIGEWDRFTVKYAYSDFGSVDTETEKSKLDRLIQDAVDRNLIYLTDADARPSGAAHPLAHLWDNGSDPIKALAHELEVRRLALSKFDDGVLDEGQPVADLEKWFVPVYLHHRYQVDATSKLLGGYNYQYAVKGDGQTPIQMIPIERQVEAFQGLLKTIEPEALVVPDRILKKLSPKATSSADDREKFSSETSPVFDRTRVMEIAADLTLANLLQPQRASRLAQVTEKDWGLSVMLDWLVAEVFPTENAATVEQQRGLRVVQSVLVDRLIRLADSQSASDDAIAIAQDRLLRLKRDRLATTAFPQSHRNQLSRRIERFLERPYLPAEKRTSPDPPPGSPIGSSRRR